MNVSLIRQALKWIYRIIVPDELAVFPDIDVDLAEHRGILKGRVLNVGAGERNVAHLIDGELINQDITWPGDSRTHIQVYSPIHRIPFELNHFDSILCIGVLEHVENPEEAVPELFRVLKPGGHLILEVPFLQPEHKVPTDYQRYTKDGLVRLVSHHGFRVLQIKGLFTVYHTLYWQIFLWLHLKKTPLYLILRLLLLRPLLWRARRSKTYSDKLATGFQLVATKDAHP